MTFNEICNKHLCDKGDFLPSGHGYAEFYDLWFQRNKYIATDICEIGVLDGNSIKSYCDYFPNVNVVGLDIFDKTHLDNERVRTRVIDQSSKEQLIEFVNDCNNRSLSFDVIIDDGSHDVEHQQLTFGILFKLIKPGGCYIIEDLGSSYFNLGTEHNGYRTTQTKLNNHTINFLNQRPFSSPWIANEDLNYINDRVSYVSLFDKTNPQLPYSAAFNCVNNYPIRSITSVIIKK